ncbi:hypothetical protein KR018_006888, partial [Drosophila ironensis]
RGNTKMSLSRRREWLYWCRLCARDGASVNVDVQDEDHIRIISKCFDVKVSSRLPLRLHLLNPSISPPQMALEEPRLGSLLCEECNSKVTNLLSFSAEVNKAQALLELLRHSEPHEHFSVRALRLDYGLQCSLKYEFSDDEDSSDNEELRQPKPFQYTDTPEPEEEEELQLNEAIELVRETAVQRKSSSPKKTSKLKQTLPKGRSNAYECRACGGSFVSAMALRSHKFQEHGGPKRYVCDSCGKQLKTYTSLVEHKLVHTDDRPCVCPICNAAFKNKARLRVHSQTHGEPRYECDVCGKKLQTRAILNKHKYVHSEERRFKCDVCGTGCKNSTAMKIHLLGHTGLRPYVCKYCGKAFASNTNCRSHKWKKHPQEAALEDENESSRVPVPTLDELRAM